MDIFDAQQMSTKLPGSWLVVVIARSGKFDENGGFMIGGMEDSLYEYLPKVYIQVNPRVGNTDLV
jgi:hypothetical protein